MSMKITMSMNIWELFVLTTTRCIV